MSVKWRKLLAGGLLLMTVLFIQACGKKLDPQESCNFVQNSQLQRVYWKDRTPVKLYIHSSVPTEFYSSIELAVEEWNRTLGREVLRIGAGFCV